MLIYKVEPVLKDHIYGHRLSRFWWHVHSHWNVGLSAKNSGPSRQVVSHGSGLSRQISLYYVSILLWPELRPHLHPAFLDFLNWVDRNTSKEWSGHEFNSSSNQFPPGFGPKFGSGGASEWQGFNVALTVFQSQSKGTMFHQAQWLIGLWTRLCMYSIGIADQCSVQCYAK